ncbi:MAG: histidine kinase N-terminal 7TM domain-containing protein [Halodesulfurarchaeum sp.]
MAEWLTFEVAILLMYTGIVPSLVNVYLLYEDWHKPGVLWFLVSMAVGGIWAFLFATFTLVSSPGATLFLANFFWAIVPTAAVAMFLLAYEYVFKNTVSRAVIVLLFSPIVALFVLSWFNPADLVFTEAYFVDANGILHFPPFDGILKVLVTQVYGYLLVLLAAGMFVGEAMRTTGIRRRQAVYLLVLFSTLVLSTMVKVADLVPVYFDPTSMVYSFSGLLFAYSIKRHGLLKFAPVARERTFEEVNDAILVVDSNDVVVDTNESGRDLFGIGLLGSSLDDLLPAHEGETEDAITSIEIDRGDRTRYFSLRESPIRYGRGLAGKIIVLSEITAVKEREAELDLLKQVLSRIFRHNIRNNLTIIIGYAEFISERADDGIAELADAILEKAAHLTNQTEKARKLEEVFTWKTTVTRPLRETVEQALSTDPDTHRRANVHTTLGNESVEFHPKFDLAIRELVENAITHHDDESVPHIRIYTEDEDDDEITLVIEDDGPGIPQNEIDVLDAEEETNLQHGSGIGLWLVRWIVDRSNGELHPEATGNGTRIAIRLSKADPVIEAHD